MFGIGIEELLVILLIILVLFGGTKVPELSRGMGKAIREFRKELTYVDAEEKTKKRSSKKSSS
jgi:TatA/E family protein of Tat protein translocase